MSRSILLCGRGFAATQLWAPRLRRLGLKDFCFYDPASAAADAHDDQLLTSLESASSSVFRFAIVASPNRMHEEQALRLLTRGVPVIVEKPVCMSVAGSRALRDAAESKGVFALRSCMSLFDPDFRKFAALLTQIRPQIGAIRKVEAHWLRASGIPSSPWLTHRAHSLAGSSLDLGWHLLEWIMAVLDHPGMSLERAVFTAGGSDATKRRASWYTSGISTPESPVDVDVAATLSLITETGVGVELRTAWDAEVDHDETAITVTGQKGTLSLRTILGMSPHGPAQPRIEGQAGIRRVLEFLSRKAPGKAHDEMVEQFVAADYSPASLGQSWRQLEAMAGVAEQIIAKHVDWQEGLSAAKAGR